jgi:hypothetical protein
VRKTLTKSQKYLKSWNISKTDTQAIFLGTGMGDLDPYLDANHGYFQTPPTMV